MATTAAVKTAGLVLVANYAVHVGSAYVYSRACVPQDMWDLARSFATTASPVCSFLLNTMQVTQNNFTVVVTTSLAALVAGFLKS